MLHDRGHANMDMKFYKNDILRTINKWVIKTSNVFPDNF